MSSEQGDCSSSGKKRKMADETIISQHPGQHFEEATKNCKRPEVAANFLNEVKKFNEQETEFHRYFVEYRNTAQKLFSGEQVDTFTLLKEMRRLKNIMGIYLEKMSEKIRLTNVIANDYNQQKCGGCNEPLHCNWKLIGVNWNDAHPPSTTDKYEESCLSHKFAFCPMSKCPVIIDQSKCQKCKRKKEDVAILRPFILDDYLFHVCECGSVRVCVVCGVEEELMICDGCGVKNICKKCCVLQKDSDDVGGFIYCMTGINCFMESTIKLLLRDAAWPSRRDILLEMTTDHFWETYKNSFNTTDFNRLKNVVKVKCLKELNVTSSSE